MNFITLIALGIAFGYSVFQRAGIEPHDWNLTLLAIGVVALVHFAVPRRAKRQPLDRIALVAAVAVLFIVALQLVPLPIALVRAISPARAELAEAALPFLGAPNSVGGASRYVPLSVVPYATAQYVLTIAGYFLVFLTIRDLTLSVNRWVWMTVWPLLLVATLEAILGIIQAYGEGSLNGMATGTYQNRDHYAGLLEMVLPFAAVYPLAVLQRDDDEIRFQSPAAPAIKACLLWAMAAILLVAIILSLSRMGFLSALAALLVAGATSLSLRGWRVDYSVRMPLWRRWFPTVLVAGTVALGLVFLPTDPLVARFADLAKTDEISADTRARIWQETAGLVKAYPLFGCGMGGFESSFFRYKTVAPMFTVDYAHNDYLQVLAELGIFGFAAGLILVGRLVQRTARGTFYARSVDERYLSIGCLAAMTAILLHSLVDFNMYIPANGFAFAWIAGIAGIHLRRRPKDRNVEADGPSD